VAGVNTEGQVAVHRIRMLRYKMPLQSGPFNVSMVGKITHIGLKDGVPNVWTMDRGKPPQMRRFMWAVTGEAVEGPWFYVGTVVVPAPISGVITTVWHLFEWDDD
jgi:hypothetical protein